MPERDIPLRCESCRHVKNFFLRRFDFRQVLEPDDHEDHCYMVVREDWARNTTQRSAVRCWDSEVQNDADNHQCMLPLQTLNVYETPYEAPIESTPESPLEEDETAAPKGGCAGSAGLLLLPLLMRRQNRY